MATLVLKMLVHDASQGDKQAFKPLFETLHGRLFSFVRSRMAREEDAIDVVQELFIDLWKELPRFAYRSDEEFLGFLFLILRRKIAKHYKRNEGKNESLEEVLLQSGETTMTEHDIPIYEDYRYLEKALNELPPATQEILRLRNWSQLSFAEISATLNIKESAAKVRHHRAIEALRNKLQSYGYT